MERTCGEVNQYTSKAKELHERVATRRVSSKTFNIVVSDRGILALCQEPASFEIMVVIRCGERGMLLKAEYEGDLCRLHQGHC